MLVWVAMPGRRQLVVLAYASASRLSKALAQRKLAAHVGRAVHTGRREVIARRNAPALPDTLAAPTSL